VVMPVEDGDMVKSHDEVLELIDDIKKFEEGLLEFNLKPVEEVKEDIIEVDYNSLEPQQDISEPKFLDKPKKFKFLKKKEKIVVDKPSATFRIRFDESGGLVNLDFKRPEPKNKVKADKKKFSLKKILPFKKSKDKSDKSTSQEKSSIGSKLKGSFGKISKLKNVIPNKSKKSDSESEESK
jgi:hypothetical protein